MGLSLKLLGEFAVRDETGESLSLPTRKTRALLAYLAVNADKPQQRERLMTLLWSDRGEQQARHSLNQALMSIRRLGNAAGVPLLGGDGEQVTLLGDAIATDLADFRDRLANNPGDAATLYHGPFLDGLTIPDPAFEEWQTATQSELHDSACDALSRAADQATDDGDTERTIDILRRLVALDPLREDAHRHLMKLLHDNGDRTGALRQYQTYAKILKKEFGVDPDAATRSLLKEIKDDTSTHAAAKSQSFCAPNSPEPQPSLQNTPYIAVLPFDNLSDDQEQEFFADGITEDIITGLSRFPTLYVVDRNSIYSHKHRMAGVRQVYQELGVRYVVQGSVRRSGQRVRVSAQLVDAESGNQLWAERYDRSLEDIFELQDNITESVIANTAPEITAAEWDRKARTRSIDMSAYDLALKAIWRIRRGYYDSDPEVREQGLKFANLAAERDPNCLEAWMALTLYYSFGVVLGGDIPRAEMLRCAQVSAEKQLELDPFDYRGLYRLGVTKTYLDRMDEGFNDLEQAIKVNPNAAEAYATLAWNQARAGLLEEALASADKALSLNQRTPNVAGNANFGKAIVAYFRGQYKTAIGFAREAIRLQPFAPMRYGVLACSLLELGRLDEARKTIAELERRRPEFVDQLLRNEYRVFHDDNANEHFVASIGSLIQTPD